LIWLHCITVMYSIYMALPCRCSHTIVIKGLRGSAIPC
jgi:hypothetical protein